MICPANQWTGFYMIGTSVMKKLKAFKDPVNHYDGAFSENSFIIDV